MQTNPAVESLDGQRVRGISPVGKEKVCGGKDLHLICIDEYLGGQVSLKYVHVKRYHVTGNMC